MVENGERYVTNARLHDKLDEAYEHVDVRLDGIDGRLAKQGERVARIETLTSTILSRLDGQDKRETDRATTSIGARGAIAAAAITSLAALIVGLAG